MYSISKKRPFPLQYCLSHLTNHLIPLLILPLPTLPMIHAWFTLLLYLILRLILHHAILFVKNTDPASIRRCRARCITRFRIILEGPTLITTSRAKWRCLTPSMHKGTTHNSNGVEQISELVVTIVQNYWTRLVWLIYMAVSIHWHSSPI